MNIYKNNKLLASIVLNVILVIGIVCVYHTSKSVNVDKCKMNIGSNAKAGQYVYQTNDCLVQVILMNE